MAKVTALGKRHLARVHEIPCVICGAHQVEAHHIREGQGMSQRAHDLLTAALCPDCHRGPLGVHGDKSLLRIQKLTELDLVAMTLEQVLERFEKRA
jgi:hypothetical protein